MNIDASANPQTAIMNKLMLYMFPLFVVVGGPFFPLAILFYWLANNSLDLRAAVGGAQDPGQAERSPTAQVVEEAKEADQVLHPEAWRPAEDVRTGRWSQPSKIVDGDGSANRTECRRPTAGLSGAAGAGGDRRRRRPQARSAGNGATGARTAKPARPAPAQ